jgi:hypothetical protein
MNLAIKNNHSTFLLFLAVLLFAACKTPVTQTTDIHRLDLVSMNNSPVEMSLSKLAREIEYIPLETRPDVLLGSIRFCVGKDWIYVLNMNDQKVMLFDRKGKFVRTIGSRGEGPGEYIGAKEIQISPDGNLIYLYSTPTSSCCVYKISGEQYSHFNLAYTSWHFARLSSGKHLMIAPYGDFTFTDEGKFFYYIQDSTGKVIRKYPSDNIIRMMGNFGIGQFFINPVSLLAYVEFSDTVFQVGQSGDMSPKYALNFGKFRTPDEEQNDVELLHKNQSQHISGIRIVETHPGIFIRYSLQNDYHLGFYRYDHLPVQSIPSSKGLIINDFNGGPDFFPVSSDGGNEVYSLLQPIELLAQKKNGEFDGKRFAKNDAHKSFVKFMDTLKDDDNPVVMIVTLKDN